MKGSRQNIVADNSSFRKTQLKRHSLENIERSCNTKIEVKNNIKKHTNYLSRYVTKSYDLEC